MIVVLPCSKEKQDKKCAANEMYIGHYHILCKTYAHLLCSSDRVFILSALYGLISLQTEIEPYNLRMGEEGCVWASQVEKQAIELEVKNESCIALGGILYTREFVRLYGQIAKPRYQVKAV